MTATVGTIAIFLDRDGTLNEAAAPGDYIRRPAQLRLVPGAAAAVRMINATEFKAIVVTNQRWLSEQAADVQSYAAIQTRLTRLLASGGARLDACYVCPHAANSCDCRKPAPGMLLRAAVDFGIDLRRSFVVGDSMTDVRAGLAVGATTVLIAPDRRPEAAAHQPHFTARSVREAICWSLDSARRLGMTTVL